MTPWLRVSRPGQKSAPSWAVKRRPSGGRADRLHGPDHLRADLSRGAKKFTLPSATIPASHTEDLVTS